MLMETAMQEVIRVAQKMPVEGKNKSIWRICIGHGPFKASFLDFSYHIPFMYDPEEGSKSAS